MASGYQRVIIVGHLGRDPDMRTSQKGTPVTRFSVAVPAAASDGEKEQAVWFEVTAFSRQAETCNEYLAKGSKVLVEGRLNPVRLYQADSGETRTALPLIADRVLFIGTGGQRGSSKPETAAEDEPEQPA